MLAGFHARPLTWLKWNLEMLVFVEGGKLENPEKTLGAGTRTNNKLNPRVVLCGNRIYTTLVGGERSHHSANPVD